MLKPADLLIIDGRHLLWRCVHAYGELCVEMEDGEEVDTGAMFGFLLLARRAHERYKGMVIVAWEAKTNFRIDLFPNYKKRVDTALKFKEIREALARGEDPEVDSYTRQRFDLGASIEEQQTHLQKILQHAGIRQYFGTHCEADDVMATLAISVAAKNRRVVIYTGDSDLFQVVDDNITVVKPGKSGDDDIFTANEVAIKTGVKVNQIPDLKALAGDSSDGIPGAKGIGAKAAQKLLREYESLEDVLRAAESKEENWPCSEKQRQTIVDEADQLRMYLKLTTINTKATLLPKIEPALDKMALRTAFKKYQFATFGKPSDLRAFAKMGGA